MNMESLVTDTKEYKNDSLWVTCGFNGGIGMTLTFDNNYRASLVCHSFSYGGSNGLYEIAVMDIEGEIVYDTPITSDVLGHLTMTEAIAVLKDISELPTR